ncbi:MAG: SH3 domain-containing protein [Firmicutes bacterium]|nr:SH3 domain-containing protein [Bacillota bacterium]
MLKIRARSYKPVSVNETGPSELVALNEGTTLQMLQATYWIEQRKSSGADPSAVLWNSEAIQYFNYTNRKMLGIGNVLFDFEEIGDVYAGKSVLTLINELIDSFKGFQGFYVNDEYAEQAYFDQLIENTGKSRVPELVTPRYGIAVRREALQRLPSEDMLQTKNGTLYYDRMANTELLPFEPVVVLWSSADETYSLVVCRSCGGWVKSDAIAYCRDKQEWLDAQDPERFLTVTGKELHLTVDPYTPQLSGMTLPMGTRLALVPLEEQPSQLHGRSTFGCYVASVPTLADDGSLTYTLQPIPVTEDVHIGYLEFTEENVLTQAFKHLGALYGWAGANNAQDCSGYAKEVYACFGITLPRTSAAQIRMQSVKTYDLRFASAEHKLALLKKAPAGSILYLPGHIMLYTGMVSGEPYVISSVGSIVSESTPEGCEIQTNQVALTSLLQTLRSDRSTWLDSVTAMVVMEQ